MAETTIAGAAQIAPPPDYFSELNLGAAQKDMVALLEHTAKEHTEVTVEGAEGQPLPFSGLVLEFRKITEIVKPDILMDRQSRLKVALSGKSPADVCSGHIDERDTFNSAVAVLSEGWGGGVPQHLKK